MGGFGKARCVWRRRECTPSKVPKRFECKSLEVSDRVVVHLLGCLCDLEHTSHGLSRIPNGPHRGPVEKAKACLEYDIVSADWR